jgi:hypothetical protein
MEGEHMHVEAAKGQHQNLASMIIQPKKEAVQGHEQGGDAGAKVQKAAAAMSAMQAKPQGVGTKVDLLA